MTDNRELGNLVKKTLNNDVSAFEELISLTQSSLYYKAYSITGSEQDAQDIVQESYINAYQKLDTLKEPEKFYSWMMTLVTNKAKDLLKSSNRIHNTVFADLEKTDDEGNVEEFEVIDDYKDHNPEAAYDANMKRDLLKQILDELSDEQRLSVVMYYYDGLKTREIASDLDVSENTVKAWLRRAKAKIEEKVLELEERKGIKLYSLAPFAFFLRLFRSGDQFIADPNMFAGINEKVILSANEKAAENIITDKAVNNTVNKTVNTVAKKAAKTVAKNTAKKTILSTALGKTVIGVGLAASLAIGGTFTYYNIQTKKLEEERLQTVQKIEKKYDEIQVLYEKWDKFKDHHEISYSENFLERVNDYLKLDPDNDGVLTIRDIVLEYIETHTIIKLNTFSEDDYNTIISNSNLEYYESTINIQYDEWPVGTVFSGANYHDRDTGCSFNIGSPDIRLKIYDAPLADGDQTYLPYMQIQIWDDNETRLLITKRQNDSGKRYTEILTVTDYDDLEYLFMLDEEGNIFSKTPYSKAKKSEFEERMNRYDQFLSKIGIRLDDIIDVEAFIQDIDGSVGFTD